MWITFGSVHEVRAFRERMKRSLWFRELVEYCVVYGDWGYRGCGMGALEDFLKERQWVVLFFYPADFTFVCPTELADLAEYYEELQSMGVEVISVSTDTKYTHLAWQRTEKLYLTYNTFHPLPFCPHLPTTTHNHTFTAPIAPISIDRKLWAFLAYQSLGT